MNTARVYVGLGSNLDQPERQVRQALAALASLPGSALAGRSRLYRTPPWGELDQPAFVNAVAALDTALGAEEVLTHLNRIEAAAGRARARRWGPRVLDLDLLLHGDTLLDGPGLRLPHPQLHLRAFVLVPLAELEPDLQVPGHGPIGALLADLDTTGIEPLADC